MSNYLIESGALTNFTFAMEDVKRLMAIHDAQRPPKAGRPSRQLEVFKRAAIILTVTAWESFIEETIQACTESKLAKATSPFDIQSTFNSVAEEWLGNNPKPPELIKWVGQGWKSIIEEKLKKDLAKLNSPTSEQVRALSKRYLNIDITAHWGWQAMSPKTAAARLDEVIKLRGALVHKGPALFGTSSVSRNNVNQASGLITKLVECTERTLGTAPRWTHSAQ
jgi:hypothetical protein